MDACIANSISQRTAYILKSLSHLDTQSRHPLTMSTMSTLPTTPTNSQRAWAYTSSKSDTATAAGAGVTKPTPGGGGRRCSGGPQVKSKQPGQPTSRCATKVQGATDTTKSRSASATAGLKSSQAIRRGNTRSGLPPSEGSGGGAGGIAGGGGVGKGGGGGMFGYSMHHPPRYETFFSSKAFQPVAMFNLPNSKTSAAATISNNTFGGYKAFRSNTFTNSSRCTRSADDFIAKYGHCSSTNSRDQTSIGSSSSSNSSCSSSSFINGQLPKTLSNHNKLTFDPAPLGVPVYEAWANPTRDSHELALPSDNTSWQRKGQACGKTANVNKKNTTGNASGAASRCKSAMTHPDKDSAKRSGCASGRDRDGGGTVAPVKCVSENPDHNNNFFKGNCGIFFTTRTPCKGVELTGKARINQLAQPKQYPCVRRRLCRDPCAPKFTPEAKQRLQYLSQPKLCHYTVCSCCLSPNCLGECTTRFNVNKTTCLNPSCVDWDRLSTPRKLTLPTFKELGVVKSTALKATSNKRIDKLSVPRKVINSGDYYIWLWNKKPDITKFLKPIQRLCITKCDMKDTRVLLRCDLDFTKGKPIDCKVRDVLPTIQMALKKGAKSIVIISRCGPVGIPKDLVYSLRPLAPVFEQYLDTRVIFLDDCLGFQAQALCEDPVPGSVFLLENLSFHPEEVGYVVQDDATILSKKEDVAKFQKIIADHGDTHITDSFSELVYMTNTTVGYPPKEFGYGFNIKKELSIFNKFALHAPVPVLAIVAGPYHKTWMVIRNLMGQVTDILVGGHLGIVFMRAIKGIELGQTECTPKMEKKALKLFSRAKDTQTTLHLPSDVVVKNIETGEYFVALTREDIDDWFEVVDIGPHTRSCFTETIDKAAAILWLGEFGPLSDGTEAIKEAYLKAAKSGTPTYAADDNVKKFVSSVSLPEECLFVTGDGEATEMLLRGQVPKGLSVLSKSRRKTRREHKPEEQSTKPIAYDLPDVMIPGGTKPGVSYGASHSLLCINHIPLEDVKVLIRVEFNEPMKDNVVINNYRMRMTIPTIKYALKWRARAVVVLAHFREPRGQRNSEMTLKPICDEMATLLGETVVFVPRTVGKDVMTTINQVHPGSVLMVENVRFYMEEEHGFLHIPDGRRRPMSMLNNVAQILPSGYPAEMNAQFCGELSRLGDIFVNDAFGALHLDHASITGNFRPTRVTGFLVKNELKYLAKLLNYPQRQFLVILGGTNMVDKMELLPGLMREADSIILAGSLACLFLKVEHGLQTGRMSFTHRLENQARQMIKLASYYKCRMHYPVDLAVSPEPDGKTMKQVSISEGIPKGHEFVDIGHLSASMFTRIIKRKNMIFWTGTTGNGFIDYERSCTKKLMEALSSVTHDPEKSAVTIVGGRGLSQIVEQHDPEHEAFTHLTTGGRTALQLLAQRHVIGLDFLLPRPGKRPLSIMDCSEYNDFRDSKVLIRCDLDLPLDQDTTLHKYPLMGLVDTIKLIQKKGAKVIMLLSHRGDPDGEEMPEHSMKKIIPILEEALEQSVEFAPVWLGTELEGVIAAVDKGTVVVLENACFHPQESGYFRTDMGTRVPVSHDELATYRARLSAISDVFVNDSFATLHKPYSSVIGISKRASIAGLSLKRQVYDYVDIRRHLDGGFLLILGAEHPECIVPNLLLLLIALDFVQDVFMCGLMAAVFKSFSAITTKQQYRDAQLIIPRINHKAKLNKVNIAYITDTMAAREPANPEEELRVVQVDASLPRGYTRCDMGPASVAALTNAIKAAKLIVLCGPTGSVLYDHHNKGTKGILDQIAAVTHDGSATSVALGMRTGQFIGQLGHGESFSSYSVEAEPFFHIMARRPLAGLHILDRMPSNPLKKLCIEQMSLGGRRVLLRLDLDVPSVEGVVLDTDKLEDAAGTITYCLSHGAKSVVLMGHRGEPGGYKNYYLRMEPLVVEISAILGLDVTFIDRPCSRKAKKLLGDPPTGSVYLMENLKFYPAESGVDAVPRKVRHSRRGEASLTGLSELPRDEVQESAASASGGTATGSNENNDTTGAEDQDATEAEEDSISDEELSVGDGEGGISVDSLMFQLMRPKTVEQFNRDLAACGDVFINDDVAHVEEPLVSYSGFGLQERGCGLLLSEFLRDSEETSVYNLPGVENLSPA